MIRVIFSLYGLFVFELGESEAESKSAECAVVYVDGASVREDGVLDNREAKASSAGLARTA